MLERLAETEIAKAFGPDAGQFGPAMASLPPRHQRFVLACLAIGEKMNHTKAAKMAGYLPGKAGSSQLKVQGHRLAHDPKVRAALVETAKSHFEASTLTAAIFLANTVSNPKVERAVRVKAALGILDRGGIGPISEHKINVNHTDSRAEKLLKLAELAKAAGQDVREVLGELADITDVDYEVVVTKLKGEDASGQT